MEWKVRSYVVRGMRDGQGTVIVVRARDPRTSSREVSTWHGFFVYMTYPTQFTIFLIFTKIPGTQWPQRNLFLCKVVYG